MAPEGLEMGGPATEVSCPPGPPVEMTGTTGVLVGESAVCAGGVIPTGLVVGDNAVEAGDCGVDVFSVGLVVGPLVWA